MAEIRVKKDENNNSPIWPWILGALVLIGLIWGIAELFDNDTEAEVAAVENTEYVEEPIVAEERVADRPMAAGAVATFVSYVENDTQSPEMGLDHQYTSEGIQHLKEALVAVANEQGAGDANIEQKKQSFEEAANKIQQDPQSLQHANTIQDVFTKAADLIESVQQKNFPNMSSEVSEVKSAANDIKASTPTLEQKEEVKKFFEETSQALQAMSTNTNANQM